MDNTAFIQIPAPKFELYQQVTLYWNNQERPTNIVRRWFDLDDDPGYWWYKVMGDEQFYPEGVFEPRSESEETFRGIRG